MNKRHGLVVFVLASFLLSSCSPMGANTRLSGSASAEKSQSSALQGSGSNQDTGLNLAQVRNETTRRFTNAQSLIEQAAATLGISAAQLQAMVAGGTIPDLSGLPAALKNTIRTALNDVLANLQKYINDVIAQLDPNDAQQAALIQQIRDSKNDIEKLIQALLQALGV